MKRKFNMSLHTKLIEQDLRQKDLGAMVRIHQSTVSAIMHGILIPSERVKLKIAKALGSSVEEVFKD